MATQTLIKHGTRAGYEAELLTGNICDRCRAAKRVYQRQYSKANRAKGIKYGSHQVLDHLDKPTRTGGNSSSFRPASSVGTAEPPDFTLTAEPTQPTDLADSGSSGQTESPDGPSLRERMAGILGAAQRGSNTYVSDPLFPDYLHESEPDPEPEGEDWSRVQPDEFIITREGMVLIEENLGTYLSVIGMTLEIVDPYCGPILADNLDEMVKRWSKIIAHYPRAAKIFMSKGGGMIMDWIGAIQATWPVLFALYEHHLARTVQTQNGKVYRVHNPNGAGTVDPTMPPADNYAYSTQ